MQRALKNFPSLQKNIISSKIIAVESSPHLSYFERQARLISLLGEALHLVSPGERKNLLIMLSNRTDSILYDSDLPTHKSRRKES